MEITGQLHGIISFASYFVAGAALTCLFSFVYAMITPYRELELIRNGNMAAAYSMSGAILGFVIPLASAIIHSVNLEDMLLWSLVAFIVQVSTFMLVKMINKKLEEGINNNVHSNGLFLGMISIIAGILNAACMSY